jgi:hypothetical protein
MTCHDTPDVLTIRTVLLAALGSFVSLVPLVLPFAGTWNEESLAERELRPRSARRLSRLKAHGRDGAWAAASCAVPRDLASFSSGRSTCRTSRVFAFGVEHKR